MFTRTRRHRPPSTTHTNQHCGARKPSSPLTQTPRVALGLQAAGCSAAGRGSLPEPARAAQSQFSSYFSMLTPVFVMTSTSTTSPV